MRNRLVLVLHLGYAFVPLGVLLTAIAAFGPALMGERVSLKPA